MPTTRPSCDGSEAGTVVTAARPSARALRRRWASPSPAPRRLLRHAPTAGDRRLSLGCRVRWTWLHEGKGQFLFVVADRDRSAVLELAEQDFVRQPIAHLG